jgi:lipoprotein-anchoring transpeptidase ErfK/SrfK
MNTISRFIITGTAVFVCAGAVIASGAIPVWADARQDAVYELDRLHQSSSARDLTDELKSADATFAIAEHYFQSNEREEAERFYLLTVQKSRIILDTLAKVQNVPALTPRNHVPLPAEDGILPTPADAALPEPSRQPAVAPESAPLPLPAAVPETSVSVGQEPAPPAAEPDAENFSDEVSSEKLVGTASTYSVVKGDTIRLISAKLGVSRQYLIRNNRLDEKAYLKVGQKLVYNNRKIIPQRMKNGIVVNIPDRTLYFFKQGKLAVSLPVALGVPVKSEKYDWKTPTGKFKVTAKMKDPTWHVPPSIQSEMEEKGKDIITSVPPGPDNPLGKFAIKTSIPGILIHSTTKPWSIYSFASHGCIRVYPEQMEEFFREVAVNTPGEIIYKPVKLAITEQGRVFLEVHRDVYGRNSGGLASEAKRLIEKQNLSGRVDWQKVEAIVRHTTGTAEDITL